MSNCLPVCWTILHSHQPVFKSHFTFTFQQNLWLPIYIFPWWNRKIHLDIWEPPRLSKSPGVDPGQLLFWTWSVIWAFCWLVLTCIWHWRQFVSTECHLGILSIGSDVYLTSRTICEHGVLFGHFRQLIWRVSTIEESVCEHWVLFGHFANWFWLVSCQELFMLGKCLFGHILRGLVTLLSSGVWVYISFVWLVPLLSFVKWELQGQFTRKKINHEIMNKLNIIWQQYPLDSRENWLRWSSFEL